MPRTKGYNPRIRARLRRTSDPDVGIPSAAEREREGRNEMDWQKSRLGEEEEDFEDEDEEDDDGADEEEDDEEFEDEEDDDKEEAPEGGEGWSVA